MIFTSICGVRCWNAVPAQGLSAAIRWHQAPFRGLQWFEYEHTPVFFGLNQSAE